MADPKPDRISLDEVRHVAKLARLTLSETETEATREQLAKILDYVASLDALDVSGVPPTFHAIEMQTPLRPDVVQPSLARTEALAAAPKSEAGAFSVPKVMEGDG